MYTALYRAYRPETFNTVLGQEHIVRILRNQIEQDTVGHAYLFCGTRGTGKTTTARLLAKGVNCTSEGERPCGQCENCMSIKEGTFMDVIEIDAASNNGVDNIRELKESVKYPPVAGRKKVYIIDEVHMLSTGAFNALLKTLEEPPENVIFILATTEPQKLPATILSRCLKLDFRRVPEKVLKAGMGGICQSMGINIDEGALSLVASNADGSVRDGLSILDQCLSAGKNSITRDDVLDILGVAAEEIFIEMTEAVARHDVAEALVTLDRVLSDGKEVRQFMRDWIGHYRNLLITKFVNRAEDMLNMSYENAERILEQSQRLDIADINDGIILLSGTLNDAKWSSQPRVLLELCIVNMATGTLQQTQNYSRSAQSVPMMSKISIAKKEKTSVKREDSHMLPDETADNAVEESDTKESCRCRKSPEEEHIDKESLWQSVIEEGRCNTGGSFMLLRTGSKLTAVNENEFKVWTSNGVVAKHLENNRACIEGIMEELTGKHRKMVCKSEDKKESEPERDSILQAKAAAENFLGIDIDIY